MSDAARLRDAYEVMGVDVSLLNEPGNEAVDTSGPGTTYIFWMKMDVSNRTNDNGSMCRKGSELEPGVPATEATRFFMSQTRSSGGAEPRFIPENAVSRDLAAEQTSRSSRSSPARNTASRTLIESPSNKKSLLSR